MRLLVRCLWLIALMGGGHAALAAQGEQAAVGGLIVRLREAPGHADLRRQSLGASDAAGRAARAAHARRWATLLSDTGLGWLPGMRLEPVGRASIRLRPARAWSPAQAERWQRRLAARAEVAWVVADTREARQAVPPNDPLFAGPDGQWWLHPVSGANGNAPEARLRGVPGLQSAWSVTTGRAGTVVAVLDSGWTDHPDLDLRRVLPGYDLVSDWDREAGRGDANDGDGRDADSHDPGDWVSDADRSADPTRYGSCEVEPSSWHGTAVTGLIAAHSDNGLGVAGIDWAARLLPVRVGGKCGATVRDIVDGLRWAAGLPVCRRFADTQDPDAGCAEWAPINPNPARIVNLSFGGGAECNAEYQDTIDELWALGIVVVAAAGNTHAAPTRPANCQRVVGVAALNRDGFKTHYSAFGSVLRIATVGGDDPGANWGTLLADSGLLGLDNFGSREPGSTGYSPRFGTSFATPIVSGTLALMLSRNPALTAEQLFEGLSASARPHVRAPLMGDCGPARPGRCACTASTCGAGILDAPQALAYAEALAEGQSYQRPNWPVEIIDTPQLRAAVALGPDREGVADQDSGGSGGGATGAWALAALGLASLWLAPRRLRAKPGRAASGSHLPGR